MSETTIGAGLSLSDMTGLDARRIIAARHGMNLNETILLRERLAGWLRAFKALKKDVSIDALVIDSFFHVWEGTGGALDMADAATTASGKPLQGLAK